MSRGQLPSECSRFCDNKAGRVTSPWSHGCGPGGRTEIGHCQDAEGSDSQCDSNVHVPLGTEWEGGGGSLSSCGLKGLETSSPPGKALWPGFQSHLCAQSLPEVESQDLRGTAVFE